MTTQLTRMRPPMSRNDEEQPTPQMMFTNAHNALNLMDMLLVHAGYTQDSSVRHILQCAKSMFRSAEDSIESVMKNALEGWEFERKMGDRLCEAAKVERTEGGNLNPGKIAAALREQGKSTPSETRRIEAPRMDEVLLACGEMTAAERRAVKAALAWFVGRLNG